MFQKLTSIILKQEKFFFLAVLLINISFIFNAKFFPSMDGPAHLHNSYLLKQLFGGSEFVKQYYNLNHSPIPNWSLHGTLALLLCFFSAPNAEKIIQVIYILLMAFSFRYFIKQIQPKNLFGSILVFPFMFSFLFHLGFLNFCLSIGFMFLGVGFYLKNQQNLRVKNRLILGVIALLAYFSNVLGFAYLVFFLFAFSFVNHFSEGIELSRIKIAELLKKYTVLFLICLVPLIFLILFYTSVEFFPSTKDYKKEELLNWVFSLRSLIVYNFGQDQYYTQVLFLILSMSFAISVFIFYKTEQKITLSIKLMLLIAIGFTFIFLLKIPDGSSAGMMSDRLCLMLFFVSLAAFISFPIPRSVLIGIVFITIYINIAIYHYNHSSIIKNYSVHADKIYILSERIREKSIVLPINLDADWMEGHFSNYLGVNKELVILENYEANVGWFPLKWDMEKMPKFMLGTKTNIGNIYWTTNWESKLDKKIDYVLIYGNTSKLDQPEYAELKQELVNSYILDESISDTYTKLFKIK